MRISSSFFTALFLIVSIFLFGITNFAGASVPGIPSTGSSVSGTTGISQVTPFQQFIYSPPTRVEIPSVGIDSPIAGMGVNKKGEMDVPDGTSNTVGWYKYGTIPGEIGSAVLDAHVYAAFSKLKKVTVGSDIYVTSGTKTLHFIVTEIETYALKNVSPELLFNRRDSRRLNLITCAGTYIPSLGTYNKRLVVYAELAA